MSRLPSFVWEQQLRSWIYEETDYGLARDLLFEKQKEEEEGAPRQERNGFLDETEGYLECIRANERKLSPRLS